MGDFEALGLFPPEALRQEHELSAFDCGAPSLNKWLTEKALFNQRENFTRTFVVCGASLQVRGYFALCTGMLLRSQAPKSVAAHGAPQELPIVLLARLAVDRMVQGKGVGEILTRDALQAAAAASRTVAFRAVLVDALDERAAGFYRKLGFVQTRFDPMKLILPMQNLVTSLDAAKLSGQR